MNAPYRGSRLVGVNARGDYVGEDHPRAKLSDAEVDLIRELADPLDGAAPLSHRQIAEKFCISRGTVGDIVSCRRRAVIPESYRRVRARFQTPETVSKALNGEW
jgi:hypothetical protein